MTADLLLHAQGISKNFGGIQAVLDYSLTLDKAEIKGLIGPNGAGKTTIFNLLSGVLKPNRGTITFQGRDVTRARPDRMAALGLGRTFQNIRLFMDMSVLQNVMAGFHRHHGRGLAATLLHTPGYRAAERHMRDKALEILEIFGLIENRDEPASILAYGDQRRLEIARALATDPTVLLLDEPAAGMNAQESDALLETIGMLTHKLGLTILLVEHDMNVVMNICRSVQVLVNGQLLTEGSPRDIQNDQRVIEAYLGTPRERRYHAEA